MCSFWPSLCVSYIDGTRHRLIMVSYHTVQPMTNIPATRTIVASCDSFFDIDLFWGYGNLVQYKLSLSCSIQGMWPGSWTVFIIVYASYLWNIWNRALWIWYVDWLLDLDILNFMILATSNLVHKLIKARTVTSTVIWLRIYWTKSSNNTTLCSPFVTAEQAYY